MNFQGALTARQDFGRMGKYSINTQTTIRDDIL